MRRVLAIDPGPDQSAYVIYDVHERRPIEWNKTSNLDVRGVAYDESSIYDARADHRGCDVLAVEMVASYGMAVGADVFETCVQVGRFLECWVAEPALRVYRRDVKLHLCGSPRAKDSNVRAALIDRYGGSREKAVGRKSSPGPLYGMKADCWQALAVAITAAETTEGVSAA